MDNANLFISLVYTGVCNFSVFSPVDILMHEVTVRQKITSKWVPVSDSTVQFLLDLIEGNTQ